MPTMQRPIWILAANKFRGTITKQYLDQIAPVIAKVMFWFSESLSGGLIKSEAPTKVIPPFHAGPQK